MHPDRPNTRPEVERAGPSSSRDRSSRPVRIRRPDRSFPSAQKEREESRSKSDKTRLASSPSGTTILGSKFSERSCLRQTIPESFLYPADAMFGDAPYSSSSPPYPRGRTSMLRLPRSLSQPDFAGTVRRKLRTAAQDDPGRRCRHVAPPPSRLMRCKSQRHITQAVVDPSEFGYNGRPTPLQHGGV
jgi:hypothetical protein